MISKELVFPTLDCPHPVAPLEWGVVEACKSVVFVSGAEEFPATFTVELSCLDSTSELL